MATRSVMLLIAPCAWSNGHMSETTPVRIDLPPEIASFRDAIRRKSGDLSSEEDIKLVEASFVNRRGFAYRYECNISANAEPSYPPDVDLWRIVSPILYEKEEYRFDPDSMIYMRSGESAEPDFLETVPPLLYEWKTAPATAYDLGRVAGIVEYLEVDTHNEISEIPARRRGTRLGGWLLGNRS